MDNAVFSGQIGRRIVSFIDLGTNSLRMLVARVNDSGVVRVLNEAKHMVRLGEGEFGQHLLQPEPMARTMEMLHVFADMCQAYGVDEIVAVATSAVRDAENGEEFLNRVREETGLNIRIISGREEARLIWRGVSSGLEKSDELRLFVDIGGGSTEVIAGTTRECYSLDSMKLGCVRLASWLKDGTQKISEKEFLNLQMRIRDVGVHVFRRLADMRMAKIVASSGTAQNLAEIAANLAGVDGSGRYSDTPQLLTYRGLVRAVKELCSRNQAERALLLGINPKRAAVIVPGAAILQTIMEEMDCDTCEISNRGLRDGLLVEYLEHTVPNALQSDLSIRDQSVFRLARACRFEEEHSLHVADLALSLFDSALALGLHDEPDTARELLRYASILHDIGIFIAFSRHHAHSHYLIRNTELLGFTEHDIEVIAATAFFHRFRPSKKYTEYKELDSETRNEVRTLSLMLAVAEALDRSHRNIVKTACFGKDSRGYFIRAVCTAPAPLEAARLARCGKRLEKYCGAPVRFIPEIEGQKADGEK